MRKNSGDKASVFHSSNVVNVLTILVITLVSVVLVLFVAKGLFASNSKDVPAGLNTATLTKAAPAAVTTLSDSVAAQTTTVSSASGAASETGTSAGTTTAAVTTTTVVQDDSVAYVVTYVQLKAQPDPDSANVICMSPNIKVNILERRTDGYVQLSFLNSDRTTITGYVKNEYLSPVPVEKTTAASTETPETTTASQEAVTTTTTAAYVPVIDKVTDQTTAAQQTETQPVQ